MDISILSAVCAFDEAVTAEVSRVFAAARDDQVPQRVFKLLLVGNSGRGKSLLCNLFVGSAVFDHKTQAGSVTAAAEFHALPVPGVGVFVVLNLPGLIEADERNLDRNQRAIEVAVRALPNTPTVVLFVCRDTHGRLSDEDTVAFHTFMRFAPELAPGATALVNNAVDDEEYESPEHRTAWEADVRSMLVGMLQGQVAPQHVLFVPRLSKAARAGVATDPLCVAQRDLLRLVVVEQLLPAALPLCPPPSLRLKLDAVAIKEETAKLTSQEAAVVRRRTEERDAARRFQEQALAALQQRQAADLASIEAAAQQRRQDQQGAVDSSAAATAAVAPALTLPASPSSVAPPFSASHPPLTMQHRLPLFVVSHANWRDALPPCTPADFSAVDSELRAFVPAVRTVHKILVLGSSGAGKSFVCNALLGAPAFEHRTQVAPVTVIATAHAAQLPCAATVDGASSALAVYDLPPTCCSSPTVAALASLAVQAALEHLAQGVVSSRVVPWPLRVTSTFVFVLAATRGRLSAEDIASANAVLDYAHQQPVSASSRPLPRCVVIVNRVEADEMDDNERREYVASVRHMVQSSLQCQRVDVGFLQALPFQQARCDACFSLESDSPFSSVISMVEAAAVEAEYVEPPRPARLGTRPLLLSTADLVDAVDTARASLEQRRQQLVADLAAMDAAARGEWEAQQRRREAEMDALLARTASRRRSTASRRGPKSKWYDPLTW
jgi:hypothetical protein